MGDRDGQVAFVTGAGRGIGLEVGRLLAAEGMTVLAGARDAPKARAAAEAIGAGARPVVCDVAETASVEAVPAAVGERLDVVVHNAAAFADWSETAMSADLDATRRLFEANLFGPWRLTQVLLPLLRESPHPRLVFVTSGGGSHGDPQFGLTANGGAAASYGVSKAAANALMAKVAAELAGTSVLVNAVDPGLTATAPGMQAMGARPVVDGARSVAWAALLPDDGPRGGFFRDGEPLPF